MSDKSSIGLRIKELRLSLKLTQCEFSKKIDIKQANLSHIENKSGKISIDILLKIISYFNNISTDWLLTGQGEMTKCNKIEDEDLFLSPQNQQIKALQDKLMEKNREIGRLEGKLESANEQIQELKNFALVGEKRRAVAR
jgi:transcriptional regulator with XRE-family HTH domain